MRRIARSTGRLGVALLAIAGSCGLAVSQEVHGRLRHTLQRQSAADEEDAITLMQNYEFSYRSEVTRSLSWLGRVRAQINGRDQEGLPSSDSMLTEPFFQVVFDGKVEASGGLRLTSVDPRGRSTIRETDREDLFARFAWGGDGRPNVDWSGFRIRLKEEDVDASTEDRSLLTVSYSEGPGRLSLGLENRFFKDHRTDFSRDSIQVTGNGDIRESFRDGKLTIGGQALIIQGRIEEDTPRTLTVDDPREPRRGLFAIDTTPSLGLLSDTPSLIDGNLNAPAADLTGDFRNIGVDFNFPREVDRILVFIERRLQPGNEVDYQWDVYTSDDGDQWTMIAISEQAAYNALLNRFEIDITPVSTRFLKVVNTDFSRAEPPLAVTEIAVTGEERRSGQETFSQSRQSGNVSVAWRPRPVVDLTLTTFASRQSFEDDDDGGADEDLNTTLTTAVRPGKTSTVLSLQAINRRSGFLPSEQDRIASLTFAAAPLETIDLSVTGRHRRNSSRGTLLTTIDSMNMRGAARLLNDVEGSLDLGVRREDNRVIDRTETRSTARLSLVSTLRPGLFISNTWGVERFRFGGPGAAGAPDRSDIDLRSRVSYRPTRVLGAAVELAYQDIGGLEGLSKFYDLDWLPFPGGALQVQMTFQQDRRSVSGNLRETSRLGVRWTMNPRTQLELAYSIIRVGEDVPEQRIAFAFLEYRF